MQWMVPTDDGLSISPRDYDDQISVPSERTGASSTWLGPGVAMLGTSAAGCAAAVVPRRQRSNTYRSRRRTILSTAERADDGETGYLAESTASLVVSTSCHRIDGQISIWP